MRAFICYSHSPGDAEFARWLHDALGDDAYPVKPIMDRESLALGTFWPDSIPVVLDACDMVLFVRSRFAVNAIMCRRELDYAAGKGLAIVNLRIDSDSSDFERTGAYLTVDFSNGREEGLRTLRKGLLFRSTPLGRLQVLHHRLIHHRDKLRDPNRADRAQREAEVARIEQEMASLRAQLTAGGDADLPMAGPDPSAAPAGRPVPHQGSEVAELRAVLAAGRSGIVMVTGPEGVGKTTAVRAAIDRWSAEAGTEGEMTSILWHLVQPGTVLGADIFSERRRKGGRSARHDVAAAIDAIGGKRLVVVLDSAENLRDRSGTGLADPQLEDLLEQVARRPGHRIQIFLISRDLLTSAPAYTWSTRTRHVPINDGFDVEHFAKLLRHIDRRAEFVPASASDRLLSAACVSMSGNPRIAELAFAYASREYRSLREVVDVLKRVDRKQVPTVVFELAIRSLDPLARHVAEAVAAFGTPVDEAAVHRLVSSHPARRVELVLRSLVRRSLVSTAAGLFYLRVSDRDRLLRAMPPEKRVALLNRAADVLRERNRAPLRTLEDVNLRLREVDILIAAANYEVAYEAIGDMQKFLLGLNRDDMARRQREALRGQLAAGDEMGNLNALARIYHRLGRSGEAEAALRQARHIAHEHGWTDSIIALDVNLGSIAYDTYRTATAAECFERAAAADHPAGRSEPLEGLARCCHRRGDLDRAFELLDEAIAAVTGNGEERTALLRLLRARWYADAKRYADAEREIEAVRILPVTVAKEQVYARYLLGRADLMNDIGHCGEASVAVARGLREALAVGDPVVVDEARATRAFVDLREGRPKRAHREIVVVDRTRPPDRSLLVHALRAVAELQLHLPSASQVLEQVREEAAERVRRDDRDYAAHQMEGLAISGLYLSTETSLEPARAAIERANDVPAPPGQRARFDSLIRLLGGGDAGPLGPVFAISSR